MPRISCDSSRRRVRALYPSFGRSSGAACVLAGCIFAGAMMQNAADEVTAVEAPKSCPRRRVCDARILGFTLFSLLVPLLASADWPALLPGSAAEKASQAWQKDWGGPALTDRQTAVTFLKRNCGIKISEDAAAAKSGSKLAREYSQLCALTATWLGDREPVPELASLVPPLAKGTSTKAPPASVRVIGLFPGVATLVWPLAFLTLGLLCWGGERFGPLVTDALAQHEQARAARMKVLLWLPFTLLLGLSNVGRELAVSVVDGRTVVSHTNWDVCPAACIVMHVMFGFLAWHLATLWSQWLIASVRLYPADGAALRAVDRACLRLSSDEADRWMRAMALIAAAFLPSTFTYWHFIGGARDLRYLPPGVVLHLIWLATMYVVTRPLIYRLRQHHHDRVAYLASLAGFSILASRKDSLPTALKVDDQLKVLEQLRPVPASNLLLALVGSLVSLAVPLLQLLFR